VQNRGSSWPLALAVADAGRLSRGSPDQFVAENPLPVFRRSRFVELLFQTHPRAPNFDYVGSHMDLDKPAMTPPKTHRSNAMKTVNSKLIAGLVAGALAGAAITANAGEFAGETVTTVAANEHRVTVAFDDLNLGSIKGQEVLYQRISQAAEAVCGSSDLHRVSGLGLASRNADCAENAIERAMTQIASARSVAALD
jgi:UrcA family protein